MYNILYSVCGEGLGHINRLKALTSELQDCRMHVFTYGDAFASLSPYPFLHQIDGYRYQYDPNGRVDARRTFLVNSKISLRRNREAILYFLDQVDVDLIITDFEPSVVAVARYLNIPLISIDNQHIHSKCKIQGLSLGSRIKSTLIGLYSDWLVSGADHYIMSHFCHDYYNMSTKRNCTVVGPFIDRSISEETPSEQDYAVVYCRNKLQSRLLLPPLQLAINCGYVKEVLVFGDDSITDCFKCFKQGIKTDFKNSLVNAKYVISTAGSMTISECKYFGKRLMVVPEAGQFEQEINAELAHVMNIAYTVDSRHYGECDVMKFMSDFMPFHYNRTNGVKQAASIIYDKILNQCRY